MVGPDGVSDEDVEGLTNDTGAGALLMAAVDGQGTMTDNGDASDRTCINTASVVAAVDCTTCPI